MRFTLKFLFIVLLSHYTYADNNCPKWLPLASEDTMFVIPIYDMQIKERDFDCDGIIDIHDHDIDGDNLNDIDKIFDAFNNHVSNIQVIGIGVVSRILDDDTKGIKHQRFILELTTGQTLLVSHNIDLAPRINHLIVGDEIEFYGEYEWNNKGGVVHWTHHDPHKKHIDGWLIHNGKIYK